MSDFYLELHKAKDIVRDEDGRPYSWRKGVEIETFRKPADFLDYVQAHGKELKNVVAFTGSSTLLNTANSIIADQAKKAGVL
jgi:hypothetical protein